MMPAYLKDAKPKIKGKLAIAENIEAGALLYNMRVCLGEQPHMSSVCTVTCYCMDTGITLEQNINITKFNITKGLLKLFKAEIFRIAKAQGMKCGQAKRANGGKYGDLTNYTLRETYRKLGREK